MVFIQTRGAASCQSRSTWRPGAELYDVEWYAYNGSGAALSAYLRIWVAGTAEMLYGGVDTTIPTGTTVTVTRAAVPAASNGPFPHGCRAVAFISLPSDGSAEINGVRVGFKNSPDGARAAAKPGTCL